jgi:hypothetical protein
MTVGVEDTTVRVSGRGMPIVALQRPMGLLRIHTNIPATVPDDIAKLLQFGDPPPPDLSEDDRYAWDQLDFFYKHGFAYSQ